MSAVDPIIIEDTPSSTQSSESLPSLDVLAQRPPKLPRPRTRGSLKAATQATPPAPRVKQEDDVDVDVSVEPGNDGGGDQLEDDGPPPISITVRIYVTSLQSIAEARAIAKNKKAKIETGTFTISSNEPYDTFKAELLVTIEEISSPKHLSFSAYEFESFIPRIAPIATKYSTEAHHQTLIETLRIKKKAPFEIRITASEVDQATPPNPSAPRTVARSGKPPKESRGPSGSAKRHRENSKSATDTEAAGPRSPTPSPGNDSESDAEKPAKKRKKKDKKDKTKKSGLKGVPKETKLTEHAKRLAELLLELESRWECKKKDCPHGHCWVAELHGGIHVRLGANELRMWAEAIMKGPEAATIDKPPNHHLFNIDPSVNSSVLQSRRQAASAAKKNDAPVTPSVTINMPPEAFGISRVQDPAPTPTAPPAVKAGPLMNLDDFAEKFSLRVATVNKLKAQGIVSTAGWEYVQLEDLRTEVDMNLGEFLEYRSAYETWAHS